MSNQSAIESYFQGLEESNINGAVYYATFALLIYDYLLNFRREVDLIWLQKCGPLSFLYILNYYPQIVAWLLGTILNSYTPHCTAIIKITDAMDLLALLANIAFQITRTSAMWGQSWIVAGSLSFLNLPVIILNFRQILVDTCDGDITSASFQKYYTIANIIGLLFSILVVILTVLKTLRSLREYQELATAGTHNVASLILLNGSLYFVSLLAVNILGIVFYFCESLYLQGIAKDLSQILSTILISRFMLALRENVDPKTTSSVQLSNISSVYMAVDYIHSVIAEEFGDPLYHTSHELRHSREAEDIALEDLDAPHASVTFTHPIDIAEFPWVAGEVEMVDMDVPGGDVA